MFIYKINEENQNDKDYESQELPDKYIKEYCSNDNNMKNDNNNHSSHMNIIITILII